MISYCSTSSVLKGLSLVLTVWPDDEELSRALRKPDWVVFAVKGAEKF